MKSAFTRRFVSSLVAVSVAVPSTVLLFPASSSAAVSNKGLNPAQTKQVERYKDEAIEILQSLTPQEKWRLLQLRQEISSKPLDFWRDQILQNPEAIEKMKNKGVTAEEASAMLRDMVVLMYTPGDTIESLIAFKKNHYHTWTKIFGTEFKQEDLLKFANMLQKQVMADLVMHHMLNIDKSLDDIINDAISRMMQHGEFKKFGTKLAEVGINAEDVVEIRKRLVREFDPNNEVRNILISAFARNNTDVIIQPGKLKPGKEKQITLKVDFPGYWTIRSGVEWTSSNPDVATIDEDGKLHAHKPGTTTVSVAIKGVIIGQLDVTVEPDKEHKPDKDKDDKDKHDKDRDDNDKNDKDKHKDDKDKNDKDKNDKDKNDKDKNKEDQKSNNEDKEKGEK